MASCSIVLWPYVVIITCCNSTKKKVVEEKFGRPINPLTVICVLSLRTVELSFLKNRFGKIDGCFNGVFFSTAHE